VGEWSHHQRGKYSAKNRHFMETKAPRLDETGFEWTPRGYTRMSWEEGFERLMAFRRLNGHFDVPQPTGDDANVIVDGKPVPGKMSDAHKLHRWVRSMHDLHRSYTLGRQSGILTEERVDSLTRQGFEFRSD
jgi:hypothetical protein